MVSRLLWRLPVPLKLLIIDDEETIVFALKRYFQREGYEVDTARELEEAEALLTTTKYGVVIADLALGNGSGTEGLELVRFARRSNPAALIVMLTGGGSRELKAEAFRRGIDAFVDKPAELEQLDRILDQIIAGPE